MICPRCGYDTDQGHDEKRVATDEELHELKAVEHWWSRK